ncbi:MAG: glycerophosphodiester phosphodiesterase family protein [Armatimonadota bacterium]|nr:glycerophosphodiester phosphodiesterase family protein [Armatimonadota bacterium]MDR7452796.1 glycerophosphodiester phosphodiesterase family protein [Armatimonadota bacterium]MDR7468225.1 glycerophosphodiester phosphodiesterase family protein [Armatimonadota bacterium]MDR7494303.1 glycerophosphodiester phosphodiesterase family protein [Armatimonadota bacterium]MDR7500530.1 glycerophosphodiester phosphodiesterase family protein [Armatimonadota bacterium]
MTALPGALVVDGRRVLLKYHALRSGRGAHPPNSLSALGELLDGGAEVIEFDVTAIQGGEYLLIHDETLERETTGTGPVRPLTPGQAKRLTLRGWDEPPALLSEVADVLASWRRPVKVQVDLKDQYPLTAEEARGFLRAIAPLRANAHLSVVVGCLADWNLRLLHRLDPALAVGLDFAFYLDAPVPEFPRLPVRENVFGYLDDHPLGFRRGLSPGDYLRDRLESLCRLVPGAVEVYLRVEFIEQALRDGVNPVAVVRGALGDVVVDGWTLNADHPQAASLLRMLLSSGVDQVTTDTAVQLAELHGGRGPA